MKTILMLHYGEGQLRGSEICLVHAVEALSSAGFNIVVLRKNEILDEHIDGYVSAILDEDFPEVMFDGSHRTFPLCRYTQSGYRLAKLVKQYKPSLIYCNSGLPCQLAVPVGKVFSVPVLCHFHHPASKRYFYIWLVKYASKLIFPSEYTRSVVEDKCGRTGDVIYNAIDIDSRFVPAPVRDNSYRQSLGIDESAIVVAQVGHLSPHKRPDFLVRCFSEARIRVGHLHLLLVGDGPMYDKLQELIKELGLADAVSLAGYVEDVLPYYQHVIDINVLASTVEGLGISVIEASACAVPSIVTDCSGLREVVDNDLTGLTFSPDDHSELADGIVRLAMDSATRQKLAQAARKKAERCFSLEHYKKRIVGSVESLC